MKYKTLSFLSIGSILIVFSLVGIYLAHKTLILSLPKYDGTIVDADVHSRVEIYRDSCAIPYILAQSEEDAAFALGYVHAQERLFQMDMMRRAGEARLSEVYGKKTLAFDQMFTTIGLKQTAEKIYASSNTVTKKMLAAYAAGVNKYIDENKNRLPVEFDVLDYYPYHWTPQHSIIVMRMMAWELNISWWADIAYSEIIAKVGREKGAKLLPDYAENGRMIIPASIPNIKANDISFLKTDRDFRNFIGFAGTHIGSNNWVVNGSKSTSGMPIIANDPHLAFRAPGIWYVACIRGGNWNAEGVTLPGVPGV